jgi:hypothetical protein
MYNGSRYVPHLALVHNMKVEVCTAAHFKALFQACTFMPRGGTPSLQV